MDDVLQEPWRRCEHHGLSWSAADHLQCTGVRLSLKPRALAVHFRGGAYVLAIWVPVLDPQDELMGSSSSLEHVQGCLLPMSLKIGEL
mmetsp:Transcript_6580/g.11441  ORF Transcript_6580/g.11441 Transcript_6580/m.11441 type:complete len:88 (+) Transcript_6580:714-977(+)